MTVVLYDKIGYNSDVLLHLPFREATGTITQDIAKPHHPITLHLAPTWTTLGSGLGALTFNGTTQYAQCLPADCADLNFMAGDYSISAWINWSAGSTSQYIVNRYELNVSGWGLYLTEYGGNFSLTIRHHHAGTIVDGERRTAGTSTGWTQGTWHHVGVSRSGSAAPHYRNGVPLDMGYSTGGLVDPETSNQYLIIGARYTLNADWYNGPMVHLKVYDAALTQADFKAMYDIEKRWFT